MPLVANHDYFASLPAHLGDFNMHLGHQRTGGVEHAQTARLSVASNRLRHAMRAENQRRACRHFVEILDEHCALLAQIVDHEFVVDDFVPYINGRAVQRYGAFDDFDGAVYTGAKTTGIG